MLDIKRIRKESEEIKKRLESRDAKYLALLDKVLEIDKKYREKLQEKEELESRRNQLSKQVGMAKAKGEEVPDSELDELNKIKEDLKIIMEVEPSFAEEQKELLMEIPNLPLDAVPKGPDEEHNEFIYEWGTKRNFDFPIKEHHEIGLEQGIFDFERGVKLAKSRFTLIRSLGAKLERALINFMLDKASEHGYEECMVPILNNYQSFAGTGQFPKFTEDVYKIEGEDLYLIPTAEVPLTNIYRDEILTEEQLPIMLTAYTPNFRSEAGAASRDTRGIIRQHQFNKIELVCICKPEESEQMHEKLTSHAESVLQALELPYRKMLLCSGDMGFSAAKCYDLEVWFPSQSKYREISSCSNFTDFQARRAMIRYKRQEGKKAKNDFVHTLNGSGLAVGRTMAAILENYQQADGTLEIPKALKPYLA